MYLYGSLAGGDFDPERSDVDFVVVTADELPATVISALEAMHARIGASGTKWAAKLEGFYIPQKVLRRCDPTEAPCPQINEGHFRVGRLGNEWVIQRHTLREQGVVVAGPAPRTLIDPVQPDDLRRAARELLGDRWKRMLQSPDPRLHGSEYQAFTILTMCRALHTLEHGTVVSKPVAARWAQATLDERWRALIERALTWKADARLCTLNDALVFIRYAIGHAGLPESSQR